MKPPSLSSGGIGKKSPSKQVIALLAIGAVLVVAGLIYFATRASHSATTAKEEIARKALHNATKDDPWVNSLGMKFVPVAGTRVLFSVWDTRVQDFETFVKSTDYDATGGMYSLGKRVEAARSDMNQPGFSQGATHPVVGVSWNDAKEFCKWLTKRERIAGNLPLRQRIPFAEGRRMERGGWVEE